MCFIIVSVVAASISERACVTQVSLPTPPDPIPLWYIGSFTLLVSSVVVGWAAIIGCLIHVARSDQLNTTRKIIWMVCLILGNIVVAPLYGWLHLRPRGYTRRDERDSPAA